MPFKPQSYTGGTIHHFAHGLTAYEHAPTTSTTLSTSTHTVIWITGLFGTLFSTPYVATLANTLPPGWVLVEPSLSTARFGFGIGSLDSDVFELGQLVTYIRSQRPRGKMVLVGWSTGCQDALHYVSAPLSEKERKNTSKGTTTFSPVPTSSNTTNPSTTNKTTTTTNTNKKPRRAYVHGIVLQGPVSDRTALSMANVPADIAAEAHATAELYVQEKRGRDVLPRRLTAALGHAPVSASRWLSLASPGPEHCGMDDMFSEDLSENRLKKTFGSVDPGVRVLAVLNEKDEYVPSTVDQHALCMRWKAATQTGAGVWDDASAVLAGANHELTQDDQQVTMQFCGIVAAFLQRVEKDDGGGDDESV